jgi:copper homeostasis protein
METPLLEVIACTREDAIAAERGGADRIELVRDLARGGLTPAFEVATAVTEAVRIPVRVMIREEEPFVVSGPDVARTLCEAAHRMATLKVDGLVLGFLDASGAVDEALLRRVLDQAPGVRTTFHRAFEQVADERAACAALRRCPQIDRVLVNGGRGTPAERLARLRALGDLLGPGIRVLSAVGNDRELAAAVSAATGLGEVHVGRAAREPESVEGPVSAAKVGALVRLIRSRGAERVRPEGEP